MGLFFAAFSPLLSLVVDNMKIILLLLGAYLLLSFIFRRARAAVSLAFGVILLIFIFTNLGKIYDVTTDTLNSVGDSSSQAASEYADYVNEEIIKDDSIPWTEKLSKALEFGLLGRTKDGETSSTKNEKQHTLNDSILP